VHQVLAGPHARSQCQRGRSIGHALAQAVAVGAQYVGEDVGVGTVVLVAGAAITGPPRLDAAAGDSDDAQSRTEQGVDDQAVGALDRDPGHAPGAEIAHEDPQAGLAVLDLVALERGAVLVDDADRVAPGGPVDAGERWWWESASAPPCWFDQPGAPSW